MASSDSLFLLSLTGHVAVLPVLEAIELLFAGPMIWFGMPSLWYYWTIIGTVCQDVNMTTLIFWTTCQCVTLFYCAQLYNPLPYGANS